MARFGQPAVFLGRFDDRQRPTGVERQPGAPLLTAFPAGRGASRKIRPALLPLCPILGWRDLLAPTNRSVVMAGEGRLPVGAAADRSTKPELVCYRPLA